MGHAYYKDDTDVREKDDSPLSNRRPQWRRSPRRCDSTTATVLLADGMAQPSCASEYIDAVWAKRTIKTILMCMRRSTPP